MFIVTGGLGREIRRQPIRIWMQKQSFPSGQPRDEPRHGPCHEPRILAVSLWKTNSPTFLDGQKGTGLPLTLIDSRGGFSREAAFVPFSQAAKTTRRPGKLDSR